jgi:hypothetical protein
VTGVHTASAQVEMTRNLTDCSRQTKQVQTVVLSVSELAGVLHKTCLQHLLHKSGQKSDANSVEGRLFATC